MGEKSLQSLGALHDLCVGLVEVTAVFENSHNVANKVGQLSIMARSHAVLDGLQILKNNWFTYIPWFGKKNRFFNSLLTHGLLDNLVIVRNIGGIDGLLERPAIAVSLEIDNIS